MRIKQFYYIFFAFVALTLASCADDDERFHNDDAPITVGVTSVWQDGRVETAVSRALPDFLSGDVVTSPVPEWICVMAPDKDPFYVKQNASLVKDPSKEPGDPYHAFHQYFTMTGEELKKCPLSRGDARKGNMIAYYTLSNGTATDVPSSSDDFPSLFSSIPSIGQCDYLSSDLTGYPVDEHYRDHLLFTLKHRTALLRLKFAVDQDYLRVRDIVLREVKINDTQICLGVDENVGGTSTIPLPGLLLSGSPTFCACAYINPEDIKANTLLTFTCTYDIYDKDAIDSAHCTRKGVVAQNKVALKGLPSSTITELKAGFYYDLNITLNPDYLYVLSEHDNKHLKIE